MTLQQAFSDNLDKPSRVKHFRLTASSVVIFGSRKFYMISRPTSLMQQLSRKLQHKWSRMQSYYTSSLLRDFTKICYLPQVSEDFALGSVIRWLRIMPMIYQVNIRVIPFAHFFSLFGGVDETTTIEAFIE